MTESGPKPPSTSVAVPGLIRVSLNMTSKLQKDGTVKVFSDGSFVFRVSSMVAANSFVWREVKRLMDGAYADPVVPRPRLPQPD